jgi:hypothetical protein
MAEKKIASLRNCGITVRQIVWVSQLFSKNCWQHFPESVLRMAVEKVLLSGFYGRE